MNLGNEVVKFFQTILEAKKHSDRLGYQNISLSFICFGIEKQGKVSIQFWLSDSENI